MKECRVLLYGYGQVGRAFAKMLAEKGQHLREVEGVDVKVMGVITRSHGHTISEEPLDAAKLAEQTEFGGGEVPAVDEVMQKVAAPPYCVDVVVEIITANYATGEPALSILRSALQHGMHGVTANKGPVVHGYSELTALGATKNRRFLFESAVMDGVPIFNLARHCLRGAVVSSFKGILNSTTNVMLSSMEKGLSFDEALQAARDIGIVEADPSGDIDGWDAAVKVAVLSTVLLKTPAVPADVPKESIRSLTPEQLAKAAANNKRYKVICSGPPLQVALEEVDATSPFFNIQGASAAVQFNTDVMGPITVVSTDPTNSDTAYGVLSDCLEAMRS